MSDLSYIKIDSHLNILLSSAGRRGYLVEYFREAVKPNGKVVATNSAACTSAMLASDCSYVVPEANNPEFIDSLLQICRHHSIGLLFSLHDWEAPFIAAANGADGRCGDSRARVRSYSRRTKQLTGSE